jgi:spore coat polysaccharide biosynthesis protein SpsF (cytidylyltransferase family)
MAEGGIVAILQARMSSSRLPGKVLAPILGRPMLGMQIERLRRSRAIGRLVVATSERPEDEPVATLCTSEGVDCFRGSLEDVLDRFYQCARQFEATHVLRLTGDCPLADPELTDALAHMYLERDVDYASNCRPPSLPDGLDAEIFSMQALAQAWCEATDPFEREHVVPFIVRRPERFRTANWSWTEDLSSMRWTVDRPTDLEFVRRVYESLYPTSPAFGFREVLALVRERPELALINQGIQRNEGSISK